MISDAQELQRQLDIVKTQVFMGKNSAFLGSLMCSQEFIWDTSIPTACWDGKAIRFNPQWFLGIPSASRQTVLLHELWHIARLYFTRMGSRDPKIWNYACDIRINNDLENEGHSFEGIEDCWKDHSFDAGGIKAEEEIYEELLKNAVQIPSTGSFGQSDGEGGDVLPMAIKAEDLIAIVTRAVQQSELAGQAGDLPGDIKERLDKFLAPKIPWTTALMQFFTDMIDDDYTWKKPNRRYQDVYLPSRGSDEGRLAEIAYIIDVSGSVDEAEERRVTSEIKYIKDVLKPEKLTIVQFDTVIQDVKTYLDGEPFDSIEIIGRGGTCLRCVKEWLEKNLPTAAVIFTDLWCDPMEPLKVDIPIIWAVINNRKATVPFGKMIHIEI